jgi:DNA-directed RNA polymerase specialized sigma24 family protein
VAAKVSFDAPLISPEYQRPTIEEFYAKFHPYTVLSVINSGVSPSDAEDVTHEIFIKFLYGGYYDSYDYKTNVTFKNFYRHVMKLYLRGMSESYHRRMNREPLFKDLRPVGQTAVDREFSTIEFVESVRQQASQMTDEQAVVLLTSAAYAIDGEDQITRKSVVRRTGLSEYAVRRAWREVADVYERA